MLTVKIVVCIIAATDRDTESVYVHASDGSDLTWYPHKWKCSDTENEYIPTHDYVLLGLYGETGYETGAWCSYPGTKAYRFICEGLI